MINRRNTFPASVFFMLMSFMVAAQTERSVELPGVSAQQDAGRRIRVQPGDNLQSVFNAVRSGDVIELPAGAQFTGPFVLPQHDGDGWVTIISVDSQNRLPAAGVRVTPEDVVAMATLVAETEPVIRTAPAAAWYHFIGVEIRPGHAGNVPNHVAGTRRTVNNLVELSSGRNQPGDMPHHIVFERSYLHGDPVLGTRRGIVLNGAHMAVIDSHLSDFKSRDDAQAIAGWEGSGPFLIRNNYLEATGENVMFGGADPSVAGRIPSDIVISGNHFYKPLSWLPGHADHDGSRWSVKNLLELKNASRVLIDGNLFEHNWPQAQNGFAILFTVRNQSGRAPWSVVEDVVFTNNIVRRVGAGISVLGFDDNYPSQRTRRLQIRNNLLYEVGGQWGSGRLFQLLDSPAGIEISHNTAVQSEAIMWVEGEAVPDITITHNIFMHNIAGFSGTNTAPGQQSIDRYFSGSVTIQGNVLIGPGGANYREGMTRVSNIAGMEFADPVDGNFTRPQQAVQQNTDSNPVPGVDFEKLCAALSIPDRPSYC
ncbi:MAG: hypothetical protein Q8K97_16250 [Pseudohongiella sp.]|nr:hypothetical protein [Pseudohongiella sp.]MDP2128920.1 hypothetical protein [Pseudohongiella sp.]